MSDAAETTRPAYPIGSVDKALRLLVMVAEKPSGLRIADAAVALGVAPSTVHRLLQMLVMHGFARQDPATKSYHPDAAMARLTNPRERAKQLAGPVLTSIVEEFGETAHLAVLDGLEALTVLSVESPHLLRVGDRAGHQQPAHRSAMGRVLLSERDPDELAADLRAADADHDADALADALARVREDGYLLQHGEVEHGVSALAVPVRDADGTIAYAIGVTYPSGRIADDRVPALADALRAAAERLSSDLRA